MKDFCSRFNVLGFALTALLVAAAILGVVEYQRNPHFLILVMALGPGLAGATVITFKYPVVGTVAPTAAQAANCNMVNAVVNMLDADTLITLVHNFKMTAAELAQLFPVPRIYVAGDSTTTVAPFFTIALTDSSTVTFAKPTTVGTQGTFNVLIERPMSAFR